MTEKLHAFTAHNLTHVGQQLDEIESISVEIMSLDKIRQKITHGEVNDGKTLAVLGMYLLREGMTTERITLASRSPYGLARPRTMLAKADRTADTVPFTKGRG